jgi:hypothetical protein
MGRPMQVGDIIIYDDSIWVATGEGTIRKAQNRFGDSDYKDLLGYVKGSDADKNAYRTKRISRDLMI